MHRPHSKSAAQSFYNQATQSRAAGGGAAGGQATQRLGAAAGQAAMQRLGAAARAGAGRGGGGGAPASTLSSAKLFHRRVSALRHVVLRDMGRGTYRPVTDAGSQACRRELAWWGGSTCHLAAATAA